MLTPVAAAVVLCLTDATLLRNQRLCATIRALFGKNVVDVKELVTPQVAVHREKKP